MSQILLMSAPTQMTDPNGNVIKHIFDENGRIIEEIDGENGSYQFLRNVSGNDTFYSTVEPEGETKTSKDTKLANGDINSEVTLPSGDSYATTVSSDESKMTMLRDGVSTTINYTTDTLTLQKAIESQVVTQPSGLKQTTTYTTAYDGDATRTDAKTQTITTNTKKTTK